MTRPTHRGIKLTVSETVQHADRQSGDRAGSEARPVGPPRAGWRVWRIPATHPTADLEIVVALLGGFALMMLLFAPLEWVVPWLGSCRFHELTGHPCPTCGVTRGVLKLAAGDVLGGVRQNPLVIGALAAGLAYTPFAWWAWLRRRPRWRLVTTGRRARAAWLIVGAAAVIVNWGFLVLDGR